MRGGGYSVHTFCGVLGWLVVLHSFLRGWSCVAAPTSVVEPTCLISQKEGAAELRCAVEADDGRIYDALALRTWLRRCVHERRELAVIPSQPIGVVKPVWLRRRRHAAPAVATRRSVGTQTRTCAVASTQTSTAHAAPPPARRPCTRRIRRSRARIPSATGSAFDVVIQRC